MSEKKRTDANEAIDFVYKNARPFAQAKANRIYCEEFRKSKKALLMAQSSAEAANAREQFAYEQGPGVTIDLERTDQMDTLREISVRFFKLTLSQKSSIAGKLNLLEEEDANQPDFERFMRVFVRARQRGLIADLDREVKAAAAGGR